MQMQKKKLIVVFYMVLVMGLMNGISFGADADEAYYKNSSDDTITSSFADAVANVPDNGTIYLNKDVTLDSSIDGSTKNISVDLNSKKLTLSTTIDVKNLNITGAGNVESSAGSLESIDFENTGEVKINAGTLTAVTVNSGTASIEFATIVSGTYNGATISNNVTINGGTFTGGEFSNTIISGSTFNPGTYTFNNDINISGGTFTGGGTYDFTGTGKVTISGGTMNPGTYTFPADSQGSVDATTYNSGTYSFSNTKFSGDPTEITGSSFNGVEFTSAISNLTSATGNNTFENCIFTGGNFSDTTITSNTFKPGTYTFNNDIKILEGTFTGGGTYDFTGTGKVTIFGGTMNPGTYTFPAGSQGSVNAAIYNPGKYSFSNTKFADDPRNITESSFDGVEFSLSLSNLISNINPNTFNNCTFSCTLFSNDLNTISNSKFSNSMFTSMSEIQNLTSESNKNTFENCDFSDTSFASDSTRITGSDFVRVEFDTEISNLTSGSSANNFENCTFKEKATISKGSYSENTFNKGADISGGVFSGINTFKTASKITKGTFSDNTKLEGSGTITVDPTNAADLSFTNTTFTAPTDIKGGTFTGGDFSNATITGGIFNPGTYSVDNDRIISGATFTGGRPYTFTGSGKVTISGGTMNPATYTFPIGSQGSVDATTYNPGTYSFSNTKFVDDPEGITKSSFEGVEFDTEISNLISKSSDNTFDKCTFSNTPLKDNVDTITNSKFNKVTFNSESVITNLTLERSGNTFDYCTFSDLSFAGDPNTVTNSKFINVTFTTEAEINNLISESNNNTFQNCTFSNASLVTNLRAVSGNECNGMTFDSSRDSVLALKAFLESDNKTFTKCTFNGITFDHELENLMNDYNNTFTECTFEGIKFNSDSDFDPNGISNSTFINVKFNSDIQNLTSSGKTNTFKGSTFNDDVTVTGDENYFIDNTVFKKNVSVENTADKNVFNNVRIEGDATITGKNNTFTKVAVKGDLTVNNTSSGSDEGNTFTDLNFTGVKATISGHYNSFTDGTFEQSGTIFDYPLVAVSGEHNTFSKMTIKNEKTIVSGTENSFNKITVNGELEVNNTSGGSSVGNTFTDLDFNGVKATISGNNNKFTGGSLNDLVDGSVVKGSAEVSGTNNTFDSIDFNSVTTTITGSNNLFTKTGSDPVQINGTTYIIGIKNTFEESTQFNGFTIIRDSSDENVFNNVEFNNETQINGDNNLFENKTKFQKESYVTLSGTGNVFNDDVFSKETFIGPSYEDTGSGTDSILCVPTANKFDSTTFSGKTTIAGDSNSFSNGTNFNTVTISANSNTFEDVTFNAANTARIYGDSNTFKTNTVFKGNAIIEKGADGNTFNGVNFEETSNLTVEGNSKFTKGTDAAKGIISGKATIKSGEYENMSFIGDTTNRGNTKIYDGRFLNGYFENENVTIYGGRFESDSIVDQPTIEYDKRLVFKNSNVTIANAVGYTSANIDGAVFKSDSFLRIEGTCKITNPIYENTPNMIERINVVGLDNNSYTEIYYKTINEAVKEIQDNKYPKTITLYNYTAADNSVDIIPGSKRVILDLNGGRVNKIINYGDLIIIDSTNTFKNGVVTLPEGSVKQIDNRGTLEIRSGIFESFKQGSVKTPVDSEESLRDYSGIFTSSKVDDKIIIENSDSVKSLEELEKYIFKSPDDLSVQSSYSYVKNGKFYVLDKGNLEFSLNFEVYDTEGNVVKSIDSDEIQDIVVGEKYIMKIFLKSENPYPVKLNGYTIKTSYEGAELKIETPFFEDNTYTIVSYDEDNKAIEYKLYNQAYNIPEYSKNESYKGLMAAQFYFTVDEQTESRKKIKFNFNIAGDTVGNSDTSKNSIVSVMNSIKDVLVVSGETKILNTLKNFEGVKASDYIYAPEDHVLAIIYKELKSGEILQFGDETPKADKNRLYYTDNKLYINESTNPKADGVFVGLIDLNTLVSKGYLTEEEKTNPTKIAEAIDKNIKIVTGNKTPDGENSVYLDFDYDIDSDGKVDYNDASLVYQMIKKGGIYWSIDENSVGNYLGSRGRLIAMSGDKARFYGTIEDVANIILHYDEK